MKILAVETSGFPASVAILEDGGIIAEAFQNTGYTHSRTLLPMIHSTLSNAGLNVSQMDAFACASGPGSFTGIRIGISTIKAFAFAWGRPCAAVSSLYGAARNLQLRDGIVCAVLDARAGNVYNAIFEFNNGVLNRHCPDRAISMLKLTDDPKLSAGRVFLAGDAARIFHNVLSEKNKLSELPAESLIYQNARGIALAAFDLAEKGKLQDAEEIVPSYLRLCQAERERLKKLEDNK